MANPLVERLKTLENTDKFRGATEEQQRGVREKFIAKHLETDQKFLKLSEDKQSKVRDKFRNRPLPGPPITASRAFEVAIDAITGTADPRLAAFPAAQALNIASNLAGRGDILPSPEPATPDEASQLDPAVAQLVGTLARLRLGFEKGTLAIGGLVPPIQRLLRDRFATQEDLVQAIEKAGGISTVRAAVTGLGSELLGAAVPVVAAAKLLNRVRGGVEALKKAGVTPGGAPTSLRAAGAAVTAGGEAVGALRQEPETSPPLTDVPAIGPAFEKLAEIAGPSEPGGGTTLRQELTVFGIGGVLGLGAIPLIPGRTTKPAVKAPVDETRPLTGATDEMITPVATEVSKVSTLPPKEAKTALIDLITSNPMSETRRQSIVEALKISDDVAATPAGELAASRIAREDSLRPENFPDVDVIRDPIFVPPETSGAGVGSQPLKGERALAIWTDQKGKKILSVDYVESAEPRFIDMPLARALQEGKGVGDKFLRNATSQMLVAYNKGLRLESYGGTSDRVITKFMQAVDAWSDGRILPASPKDVPTATRLSQTVAKQMKRVEHPSKVGKRGAGPIKRIATASEARLVASMLTNRGFESVLVRTDGQSGNFHVVWNVPDNAAAKQVADVLVRKSQVDPTLRSPDGSQGGVTPQEQTAVKASEADVNAAATILKAPKPKAKRAKKAPRLTIPESEVDLPAAALAPVIKAAKDAGLLVNKAANVIELTDKLGNALRRVEFGKNRIITNAPQAINEANSVVAKIRSGRLNPDILRTQSIIARTIDDAIEEAGARGVNDSVDRLTLAADVTRNLDMTAPGARNNLSAIRGALLDGDEIGNRIFPDDDFEFVNKTLGDTPARHINNLKDVVSAIDDPVIQRSLISDAPDPPSIPRLTQRAEQAIKLRAQGQYADDLDVLAQNIKDLDKMVRDGTAVTLLKSTADRLSDPRLPLSRNPMQGQKITAEVTKIPRTKDKVITIHDVALNETQKFPFDGRGVADAVNYIESGPRRLSCILCDLGLRGGVTVGENRVAVINDRAGWMRIFPSHIAVARWARQQVADGRTGADVQFPDDIPVEALGKWGQMDFGGVRGTTTGPLELAPDGIPALRRVVGGLDPIKTWFQGIENKFPKFPVFSQIWEPVEAGATAQRQWITAKHNDLVELTRGVGDDQAQGMQLHWMVGLKNKNAAAQIKDWYRLSEQDLARGEQFRQKLISFGNDHGLDIDDFMQNQMTRIMQNRGLVDQAFPAEIPREALFFRSAFREDEVSARHIDIRDLSMRLTRMMGKETFLRPAVQNAERMMESGLGDIKGLAGPVRQYLDAQVSIPPESRIRLNKAIEAVWLGGVTAVQNLVVKRIGTTSMDEAFSRHLENVRSQDLIGPWVDFHLSNVYGALMAWRPGVVVRNMPQSMLTILPRVGPKAWLLGMRDALRQGGFEAPRKSGAVDDVVALPFSEEIAESAARARFGKSKVAKLFSKTQAFTEAGLIPFTAVDRFHRATAYHAMKHLVQASTKAAPDVWARSKSLAGQPRSVAENQRLANVSEAIGIDMFGPIVSKQGDELLAQGRLDDAISYLGRNLAEDTQWIYRKGNQAGLARGTSGKIFLNFSTWPTWFGRYALNLTTQGTVKNRAKAIATFAAVNEGMFLAGREIFGVDASHWLYWHPLNYGGGTNLEAAIALAQAEFLETPNNRDSFQQRKARRVWETYWERQVPGFKAIFQDGYNFYGANSPQEAFRKGLGFPEAGPGTRSSFISGAEAVANFLLPESLEVDLGGRPGRARQDVELVPLP